ncbi:Gfo/Idh/MocA family oxidoreductase [Postechiella marina]|uniref:Gfo/Idh/MocA family oxidoreductase n=1 Tax=Postechiella marina TaxID=943941 RepID=A0ABP8C8B1_9FLAO
MNDVIKTGVLSFGMSGSLFHCPFLNMHPKFNLKAIVERSTKKAQVVYPDIKSYNTVTELLNDDSIELVVINTPSSTHFDFALQAIRANKHIIVEKPFTVTSAEAKTLFKEAKTRNCIIMPFQNRRYDSDFLSVKKVIESGKLGRLIEVHFRYDRYKYAISTNITKESPVAGNGLLYNLGPHLLDASIALFGKPESFNIVTLGNRPETQVDDYAHVHLKYNSGMQVYVTASLLVANALPAFVLHGTKGSYIKNRTDVQETQLQSGLKPDNVLFGVEKPNSEGVLTSVDDKGVVTEEKIASEKASYINFFEAVYQTLVNKKPFPITEYQIINQLEILESAF